MMYGELTPEQQYFHDVAWGEVRNAYQCFRDGRKAKAQEHLREARYYLVKVPAEFTEPELIENIEKLTLVVTRGY